jgi:alpha-tubulin suppressor-like RCC1 family protein
MNKFLVLSMLFVCRLMLFAQSFGEVIGWGNNGSGQATGIQTGSRPYFTTNVVTVNGNTLTNASAIAACGVYSLALKTDGTVAAWGYNNIGQATGAGSSSGIGNGLVRIGDQVLSNVTAIDAGIALKKDGTVVTWGIGSLDGQRISAPADLTNVVAVATGAFHCLVLKKDGTVITLGTTKQPPNDLSNVVAIAAGKGYGFGGGPGNDLALKKDGSVVSWRSRGMDFQDSLPKELTNVTAIATGGAADLALTRDGRVFGWGINQKGQATGTSTTNYIASGFVSINGQTLQDVTAIAAGDDSSLALKKDGTVVAWGGVGLFGGRGAATVPEGLIDVVAIAAGSDYFLAITTNSTVAERLRQK